MSTTPTADAQTTSQAQRTTIMVPMRDGTRLSTDIYTPTGTALASLGPRPVLLERSPYDIRTLRRSDGIHADGTAVTPESGAAFFVDRGYIVVRQDCRGRGRSEGEFAKYTQDAEDGFDTYTWVGAQPWCDGRIATYGVSYSAHAQTAAASVGAPNVAAMILDSGGFSDAWQAGGRFGGAFELKQATWAYRRMRQQAAQTDSDITTDAEFFAWLRATPWRRGASPLAAQPEYEDFVLEQWAHEDRDEFWKAPGLCAREYYDMFPDVPVLSMSSWYDPYVFTAIENFHALRRKNLLTRLVMGPWVHGARSVTFSGDVDFGANATLDRNLDTDYLAFKAHWLSTALAGEPPLLPPVSYFLMGGGTGSRDTDGRLQHGGEWCTATEWPPQESTSEYWYLGAEQTLTHDPAPRGAISFDFDPRHPVPSRGGGITSGEPFMTGGAYNQDAPASDVLGRAVILGADTPGPRLPLSARKDVVSFTTAPLATDVVVAGGVVLELVFSSSAPDTDITVKLIDVYPPSPDYPKGYAMNITDGMLRCRYRNDPAQPELMTPGNLYNITIRLPDTANRFVAGHRIRLDISSSNFPRCDVNPNTGAPVASDRTWQIARNTLHTGTSRLRTSVITGAPSRSGIGGPGSRG